ncbi:ABC transporter permease [Fusobacterium nucleatum subsp. nucleatum ATCC 23726]|uniref:ABC transporter, permease protein n=1 Tax=Fusobacterium nucleatum subsp. nucleatum (strain ATCC 23726 / VPI 4351) TaxID=525283 RepID=D5RC34_FUSN2|nr:ABC transporter permease [Fusobacterium nucleatum]AVQ22891.1 ABC transporter permease [Fusobacterium nucleatum subsp. nucleatum ATCC 23726]EFG95601.1 ABC transporter, permease protein [Fusobacterium nucleatum subsp. nucleatum ATCC 23726]
MKKKYIVLFFILLTIHFILPRIMKADPFVFLSSDGTEVASYTEEEILKYKQYYGLDMPLWRQYLNYLLGIFTGNLGYSIYFKEKVTTLIFSRLVWTAGIVIFSLCISSVFGLFLGSFSAWNCQRKIDTILYQGMVIISEIPSFLTANMILMFFIIKWRILPTAGGITPFIKIEFSWNFILDIIKHAILPSLTLTFLRLPDFYFVSRSAMLQQIQKKYVETAQAKSLGDIYILMRHCLPNAINPIMTRFLLSIQTMFNATLIVENVFKYPGIGKLIRDAVFYRDYLLLQGIFLVITIFILTISFLGENFYQTIEKRKEL